MHEMAALAELGREILGQPRHSAVSNVAGRGRTSSTRTATIYLADPDSVVFTAVVALGEDAEAVRASTVRLGEGVTGAVAANGAAELVNDLDADPRAVPVSDTVEIQPNERLMVAPLLARDQVLGLMAVWRWGRERPFAQGDLDLLVGLSQQAAIAIENARLFGEAEEARRRGRRAVPRAPSSPP